MFNNIKGYLYLCILVGMYVSCQWVVLLLGCEVLQLVFEVGKVVKKLVVLVVVLVSSVFCQEQIFLVDDLDFDLCILFLVFINIFIDVGFFFCLGLVLVSDFDDVLLIDVIIYCLCVQGWDELLMFFVVGCYIEVFCQKVEVVGKLLLIIINMGFDLVIYIGVCFEVFIMLFGYNELGVVGVLC